MKQIFKKSRILFDEMVEDAKAYFITIYKQSGSVFTPASPWGQLLNAIIGFAQKVFFYIEDSITELHINTASRPSSIKSLARLAGHNPTRAIGASGEINISLNGIPIEMSGSQIIIPNNTKLKCLNNGLFYTIKTSREDIRLNVRDNRSINVKIIQGFVESQTFTGTGRALQSFNVYSKPNIFIDNFNVVVYVNGTKYNFYESLYDMPKDVEGCIVKTSLNSGIDVFFGNGFNGKIPPRGSEIIVEYLVTDGVSGNIFDISDKVRFKIEDPIFDVTGQEINVDSSIDIKLKSRIVLGSAPESIELTRILTPRVSRSFVLATPENYVTFLRKFNYFSIVDAFTTYDDDFYDDDNVIYIFLIPDISKRLKTTENYFTVSIDKFNLSDDEIDRIRQYVVESGSMILTSEMRIIRPTLKKYIMNISIIIYDDVSPDLIKEEIISKINLYLLSFIRRDRIPQSDIVSIIESIKGIDSVNVRFLCENNEIRKAAWLAEIASGKNIEEPIDIGLDSQGDIIIGKTEFPVIRGGWQDRNGVYYNDNADLSGPSSINIYIKDIIQQSIHNKISSQKLKQLK